MLARILVEEGGRSAEQAENHIAELKRSGRYQRDVY
jgi:sulfite reductase alpha subunit-like flavoprotein